ncbi:MAG: type II toxin-antitoxin system RatA family toxin [Bacteroidota bacterium]
MPSFRTVRRVPFTPRQMFDLVADVETYPQFLPLCQGLRVKSRERSGDIETIVADMDVGYRAIRETFPSCVSLDHGKCRVKVDGLGGPFQRLENRWSFNPAEGGCDVDFFISYELRSIALSMLVGAMFEHAFRRFAEAFEARARVVYGDDARSSAAAQA